MTTTIRDYITHDMMRRLSSRLGAPPELTLEALARHYGVSFTPVRQALRQLVNDGVLLRRHDGQVRLNPDRSRRHVARMPTVPVTPPNRAQDLEAALAADVIARSLKGSNHYLREEATASQFGVGRTAIRQALSRLAGRGLVVHVARRGWRVRTFDQADLDAYLEIREVLELTALELARPSLDKTELKRMLAGNIANGRSPRLDNQLHRYILEKARNAYILDFFERHGTYYTTLFDFAAPETHVVAAMARQHRQILRALIAGDWARARRTLAHHIRAQRPIVKELMQRLSQSWSDRS